MRTQGPGRGEQRGESVLVTEEGRREHVLGGAGLEEHALDRRSPPQPGRAQWGHQHHPFVRAAGDADREVVRGVRTDATCQQQFDDLDPPRHRGGVHQLGTIAGPGRSGACATDASTPPASPFLTGLSPSSTYAHRLRTPPPHGGSVPRRRVGVHEGVGKGLAWSKIVVRSDSVATACSSARRKWASHRPACALVIGTSSWRCRRDEYVRSV